MIARMNFIHEHLCFSVLMTIDNTMQNFKFSFLFPAAMKSGQALSSPLPYWFNALDTVLMEHYKALLITMSWFAKQDIYIY